MKLKELEQSLLGLGVDEGAVVSVWSCRYGDLKKVGCFVQRDGYLELRPYVVANTQGHKVQSPTVYALHKACLELMEAGAGDMEVRVDAPEEGKPMPIAGFYFSRSEVEITSEAED